MIGRDSQTINSDIPPLGGRYKLLEELGAGGFGQTFLAQDLHLPGQPECVVKQLKPQTNDAHTLQMARRLFDTEAQVLYQLGHHEQIPRLLAHFEEHQEFYLVQEFIEGEPLNQELVSGQLWSEAQAIALLQDILQVLAFVHQQNVIHRDIKPPNLIRRRCDGKIVLIDFGAVKQVSSQAVDPETGQTNLTITIGTKGYMANEQLAGNPRFCSDVYAVGLLGLQALTGIHPKRLKEDPRTGELEWREHATHVSSEFADILDKMVRYDFRDRYPTALEALEALQSLPVAIADSLPPPQPASEPTAEDLDVPTTLAPPSLSTAEELEEFGIDLESTNSWTPAAPPEKTEADTSLIEPPTATLLPKEPPQSSEGSVPTSATPRLIQRRWVKPLSGLAAVGAVAGTFAIAKTLLSPQPASQIVYRSVVPAQSPTASPSTQPSSPPKATAASLVSQANRLREAGQYDKALELYDKAIALKPDNAQAYWGRCYSLNKLNKPAEAVVACNDALDLKPNYPEALWSKGNALERQNLDLEALQLYERTTKLKPKLAEAWVDYGVALQGFGRSEEAIKALDKAIALKRNSAKAWSTKGQALVNLGRFEKGIAALDKALQIQPNQPDVMKMRQKAQQQLGR